MKAQAFLALVSEMMTAQQDYFKARKAKNLDTHNMLVAARDLERKVMAVIDEGRLEPDDIIPEPQQGMLLLYPCQVIVKGKRCNKTSVQRILARDEVDQPCSIYICADCLEHARNPQMENEQ